VSKGDRHDADPRGACARSAAPPCSDSRLVPPSECRSRPLLLSVPSASDTAIVRPSISATVSSSSLTATSRTWMSALSACTEELRPRSQQLGLALADQLQGETGRVCWHAGLFART